MSDDFLDFNGDCGKEKFRSLRNEDRRDTIKDGGQNVKTAGKLELEAQRIARAIFIGKQD